MATSSFLFPKLVERNLIAVCGQKSRLWPSDKDIFQVSTKKRLLVEFCVSISLPLVYIKQMSWLEQFSCDRTLAVWLFNIFFFYIFNMSPAETVFSFSIVSLIQFPGTCEESSSPFVFICTNPQELLVKFPMKGKHKICKSYFFHVCKSVWN